MSQIKTVALTGATGTLGTHVLSALVATKAFAITVLARDAAKTSASLPPGVAVKEADFTSLDSLTAALSGFDALVNTTNIHDPALSVLIADAAAAAGVSRYIPADFGLDPLSDLVASLPVFANKAAVHKRLEALAAKGEITYTSVCNGPFLDWCLATGFTGIDLKNRKVTLFDGGDHVHPWTELAAIGKATAGVLLHPEETRNRPVYVHSINKSQRQVAALAREALGGEWEETLVDISAQHEQSMASIKAGVVNFGVLAPLIQYATCQPEANPAREKDDNELLGVPELTDDEIKALIRRVAGVE